MYKWVSFFFSFLVVMQVGKPFRFHSPSSILVVGPSGCGKTVFTEKLLLENPELIETPPTQVHCCYRAWQDRFRPMQNRGVMFHEGIPDHQALVQWFPQGQGVVVLDDLMDEGSNDKRVLDLFTKYSHHQNVTVLYLCQDMFPVGRYAKSISRNAGINWGYAMCCFNRFPLLGKTVWKPFITPLHGLMGIWCWICTQLRPINSGR